MRIVFMGTPEFAVPSLEGLVGAGHQLAGVFSQPDRPVGRHHNKLQPTPVKERALAHGIPVYQPETLRDGTALAILQELDPWLIVVAAYGRFLPDEILALPPRGCINVHSSLLPQYRGAAPIQWAVINGEQTTGVTTMFMGAGVDTGDMLLRRETAIGLEETAGQLFDRLKDMGAQLLGETLAGLEKGELRPVPQNHEEATLAPMLQKELSQIDWSRPAEETPPGRGSPPPSQWPPAPQWKSSPAAACR